MNHSKNDISQNVMDFMAHCDGWTDRRGFWFLKAVYQSDAETIRKAVVKCLKTLRKINKEGINELSECVLIDRVYELNYRVLARYLNRKSKKSVLVDLQRINFFVQGIVCGDVEDLGEHYEINKGV